MLLCFLCKVFDRSFFYYYCFASFALFLFNQRQYLSKNKLSIQGYQFYWIGKMLEILQSIYLNNTRGQHVFYVRRSTVLLNSVNGSRGSKLYLCLLKIYYHTLFSSSTEFSSIFQTIQCVYSAGQDVFSEIYTKRMHWYCIIYVSCAIHLPDAGTNCLLKIKTFVQLIMDFR